MLLLLLWLFLMFCECMWKISSTHRRTHTHMPNAEKSINFNKELLIVFKCCRIYFSWNAYFPWLLTVCCARVPHFDKYLHDSRITVNKKSSNKNDNVLVEKEKNTIKISVNNEKKIESFVDLMKKNVEDWTLSWKLKHSFFKRKMRKRFASVYVSMFVYVCIFFYFFCYIKFRKNRYFDKCEWENLSSVLFSRRRCFWQQALKSQNIYASRLQNETNKKKLFNTPQKQRIRMCVFTVVFAAAAAMMLEKRRMVGTIRGEKICRKLQFGQFLIDFPFYISWRMKVIHHSILICVYDWHIYTIQYVTNNKILNSSSLAPHCL